MPDLRPMDATLDGYAWLPRMIDKSRHARAGTLGTAVHPCPVDRRALALLGIDVETFGAVVAAAGDDDAAVLDGLRAAGIASAEEAWFDAPAWEDELQEMVWRSGGEPVADRAERTVTILHDAPGLTVTWSRYVTGERGPDLHLHHEHLDAFYILSGAMRFELGPEGERTVRAPAGTFVAAPVEVAHSFVNAEDDEVTWLNFHGPDAGFAAFLRDGGAWDSAGLPLPDGSRGRPAQDAIVVVPGADGLAFEGEGLRVTADRFKLVAQAGGEIVSYCLV
jgi:mannose-6-phosphate isomerase-like protein (cupin superfamily)